MIAPTTEKKPDETKPIEGEFVEAGVRTRDPLTTALAPWTPKFIESIETMTARRDQNLEYMRKVLKKDVHYGVIPGTGSKPTLLKPGAQALCRDLGLHPEPVIVEHEKDVMGTEHGSEPFLSYNIRTDLYALNRETGERMWVGAGFGSCNSWEERYRWRTSQRLCPTCSKAAVIKGNPKYAPYEQGNSGPRRTGFAQGGWLCWKKKDGCGAIFADTDPKIIGQEIGRVPNDRVMDLDNTIFKQAAKRSLVEAVLNVTGASDVFTQDVEESTERDERHEDMPPPPRGANPDATHPEMPEGVTVEPAVAATTPMTDEHKTAIRNRYRFLFNEVQPGGKKGHPVLSHGWNDFVKAKAGGHWETLWLHDELYAEAAEILGIETAPVPGLVSPDEIPA